MAHVIDMHMIEHSVYGRNGVWLTAGSLIVAALVGSMVVFPLDNGVGTTLYVSPEGDDTQSGVNPKKPLKSPGAAIQRLREYRDRGADGPFEVVLGDGIYRLLETLEFTIQDAGTAKVPVVWRAEKGGIPVLSGGEVVTGWKKPESGEIWTVEVDQVAEGNWNFNQLWVNDRRASRARFPSEGFLKTAGPLPEFSKPREHRYNRDAGMGFRFREGDLKQWEKLEDVNIFLFHSWTASLHWLESVDIETSTVRFVNPSGWPVGWWEREGQRYFVENTLEALNTPGEWYLDRTAGRLHYWPREREEMEGVVVVAPRLRQLVRIVGDSESGTALEGLRFEGISFQHANWEIPNRGVSETGSAGADGQAANFTTAAIYVSMARHVEFRNCEVSRVGEYGLWLAKGSQYCKIKKSRIHDVGAGAIRIGEGRTPEFVWEGVENNIVDNCWLYDGGNVFPSGCGILVQKANFSQVTHNEISDFYYTGISVGWSWGFAESTARQNHIRYNRIYDIGKGLLSDMGGIYTLGVSPGTEITHNIISDVNSYGFGGWGLYADEGSSGILMSHNLVYNTGSGGFHQHHGKENMIRNNIFAFSGEQQIRRSRGSDDHISFYFEQNVVVFDEDHLLGGSWGNDQYVIRNNVYWNRTGAPLQFVEYSMEEWNGRGHDRNSFHVDPRFMRSNFGDRKRRPLSPHDFRLREDSPAFELGFEPLEIDRVGRYGDGILLAR